MGWSATLAAADFTSSLGFAHFSYEERAESRQVLNSERGVTPGIRGELRQKVLDDVLLSISLQYFASDIRYRGRTQAGADLRTRSDLRLTLLDLSLSGVGFDTGWAVIKPRVAAGFRRWQRDIHPTRSTLALKEGYQWLEAGLGIAACRRFAWDGGLSGCLESWALYSMEGRVKVNLSQFGAGKPSLRLGSEPGAMIQASVESGPVALRVFGHYWQFGASESKTVERVTGRLVVTEPASHTWLTGIELGYRF